MVFTAKFNLNLLVRINRDGPARSAGCAPICSPVSLAARGTGLLITDGPGSTFWFKKLA
jgi:hypothetical protein